MEYRILIGPFTMAMLLASAPASSTTQTLPARSVASTVSPLVLAAKKPTRAPTSGAVTTKSNSQKTKTNLPASYQFKRPKRAN
jgi:hypothetical protein